MMCLPGKTEMEHCFLAIGYRIGEGLAVPEKSHKSPAFSRADRRLHLPGENHAKKEKAGYLLLILSASCRKAVNETEGMRPIKVEDIDISILRQAEDENLMEGLSYFLYSVGVEKYHGLEMNEPEKRRLLNYCILLGYSGKASEELYRQNMDKYDQISFDQKKDRSKHD